MTGRFCSTSAALSTCSAGVVELLQRRDRETSTLFLALALARRCLVRALSRLAAGCNAGMESSEISDHLRADAQSESCKDDLGALPDASEEQAQDEQPVDSASELWLSWSEEAQELVEDVRLFDKLDCVDQLAVENDSAPAQLLQSSIHHSGVSSRSRSPGRHLGASSIACSNQSELALLLVLDLGLASTSSTARAGLATSNPKAAVSTTRGRPKQLSD